MRFWITFGVGLVLGIVAGAFLAVFILFDDLIGKTPHTTPMVAHAYPEGERPLNLTAKERPAALAATPVAEPSTSPNREPKPPAIVAEPVDLDLLYPTEAGRIIVNAKREEGIPARTQ